LLFRGGDCFLFKGRLFVVQGDHSLFKGGDCLLKGEAVHCLRDPGRRPFIIQGRGLFVSFKGGDSLSFTEGGGRPSFKGRDCFCHLREGTVCRSSREAVRRREGTVCHSREGTIHQEKRLFIVCQGREESSV